MEQKGYHLSPKTKNPHSIDSWLYDYINLGGNKDNIKIEIYYSLRSHIFPAIETQINGTLTVLKYLVVRFMHFLVGVQQEIYTIYIIGLNLDYSMI
jgi:hypothetical protein